MLTLLVFLLVTHQVTGQLQCPKVAASFGDDLDLSSFYLQLGNGIDDGTGGDTGVGSASASGGGSCKFFIASTNIYLYLYSYSPLVLE